MDATGVAPDARESRDRMDVRLRRWWLVVALVGSCVCASRVALGHRAPGGRSVVAQVEPCQLVLLVSWTPPSGDETNALLADAARAPGRRAGAGDRLRALYAARALAPLSIRADGQSLSPRSFEVKLVRDPPRSGRVAAVVLVSFALPPAMVALEIANTDSHRTRFSWVDRSNGRFASPGAPTGRWSSGVASILLQSRISWPLCPDARP
jgi:hypothetical protein